MKEKVKWLNGKRTSNPKQISTPKSKNDQGKMVKLFNFFSLGTKKKN